MTSSISLNGREASESDADVRNGSDAPSSAKQKENGRETATPSVEGLQGSSQGGEHPDEEIRKVFRKLRRAWEFSKDCQRSMWDFAVEIGNFNQEGVSHETLRWLIGKGLIEHGIESREQNGHVRQFDSRGGFTFDDRSCFVITDTGLNTSRSGPTPVPTWSAAPPSPPTRQVPRWDDQRHELWFGHHLVKRFKWRASNQETVLAAFEEEGWPARIDDPLPPNAETDPKRRLSDAIKCLNRKQANSLIRFSGDGTGEGVLWDIAAIRNG